MPEIRFGTSFRKAVESVRSFCDRNGAFLIVKSRLKLSDPDWLVQLADLYLDGSNEEYYPCFTTYQLLAVADLSICFGSYTAMESVIAGVPVLNVFIDRSDRDRRRFVRGEQERKAYAHYSKILHTTKNESPFNYPGCVYAVDRRKFVKWLTGKRLSDFTIDEHARQEYIVKYAGISPQSSSRRILDSITRRLLESNH